MLKFKSAILPELKNCQNGTSEPDRIDTYPSIVLQLRRPQAPHLFTLAGAVWSGSWPSARPIVHNRRQFGANYQVLLMRFNYQTTCHRNRQKNSAKARWCKSLNTQSFVKRLLMVRDPAFWAVWAARAVMKMSVIFLKFPTFEVFLNILMVISNKNKRFLYIVNKLIIIKVGKC